MEHDLKELIELIERLSHRNDSGRSQRMELIARAHQLFDEIIYGVSGEAGRRYLSRDAVASIHTHLYELERRIDSISVTHVGCALGEENVLSRFPQMLTALDNQTAGTSGYQNFITDFRKFFSQGTAVIVDPYIFTNAKEIEADYCTNLLNIIGEHPERIDFYFIKKGYKKSIADAVFNSLKLRGRTVNLFECANIHDRVWMKNASTIDDPSTTDWEARVVGASVNGIAKRPTYVVDMLHDDAQSYAIYLSNVRASAQQHASPP